MELTLTISLDNAAFSEGGTDFETSRLLRGVAELLEDRSPDAIGAGNLYDVNGNRVGRWSIQ